MCFELMAGSTKGSKLLIIMEKLTCLKCGIRNGIFILVLQFLWKTETDAFITYPEYCFNANSPSFYKQHKNESWKTTIVAELLQQMFQCYDPRVRAEKSEGSRPTEVTVSMYILSIGNFQVRQMDFQVSFYFRQIWQDARLAYGDQFPEDEITLGGRILEQLWLPKTYFVNKKGSGDSTDDFFFVKISRNGTLFVSRKNTLTMDCYMDLRNFPFDDQKCNLTIASFGFSTKDVIYKWISKESFEAVERDADMSITEFDIGSIRIFETVSVYKTGIFSSLKMELNFHRKSIYYLIQIYIPSGMIVVLSWISFWIDNQSIPARTALGITTVLAMTTLLFGLQSSLPSVPYIKAVDLFMIVSFANVFAALIEFAVVNYTSMREKQEIVSRPAKNKYTVNPDILMLGFHNRSFESEGENGHQNGADHNGTIDNNSSLNKPNHAPVANGTTSTEHCPRDQACLSRDYPHVDEPSFGRLKKWRWRCKITANGIDAWSRVLFPLAYGLFIVVYWIGYASSGRADNA